MCPPSEGERLAEMLRRQGAEVETKMILAGHNLTNLDVTAAQKFVATHWPPVAPAQNFAL
jgi:predicted esterase